jgi:hypothetical protein
MMLTLGATQPTAQPDAQHGGIVYALDTELSARMWESQPLRCLIEGQLSGSPQYVVVV